tara:strand:- start:130 stop:492 length:363 start_codon:yes stop_codon:yes gene_type:complete
MTNEEAIKFIQSEYDFDSKSVMLARMFAMEDIIEHDVQEWVRMPLSAGLAEFIEHTRHANDICIPQYVDNEGARGDQALAIEGMLRDVTHKMEIVMIAMQVYSDIQEKIREKFVENEKMM